MSRSLILGAVLAAACGPFAAFEDPVAVTESVATLGEQVNDYPNASERAFHYLTNRARIAPTAPDVCGRGFDVPATPPLEYDLSLNQVARFHARQMELSGCFQHASCGFPIGTGLNTCSSATPPEAGGTCGPGNESHCSTRSGGNRCPSDPRLGTFYRFDLFGYAGNIKGENIARGYPDERAAFCAFFLEGPEPPVPDGEEHGHFENIADPDFNQVGHGVVGRVYVQDLGGRRGLQASTIPSAAHWRRSPGSNALIFGAIWNASAPPQAISVVVGGVCTPLALEAGTAARGAYEATIPLGSGCHAYYFVAKRADGSELSHPDNGSFVAAVDATCADATTDRASSPCGGPACTPGGRCTAPDWCRTGVVDCSSGAPVCAYDANAPDGTPCGNGQLCIGGSCGTCSEGTPCDDPGGDPCRRGTIDCSSGAPVCSDVVRLHDGASCGEGRVCSQGACVECADGESCHEDGNPCRRGRTSCSTGVAVCSSLVDEADATPCGNGRICLAGSCERCADGSACRSPDGCRTGVLDCASATCSTLEDASDGTPCDGGSCQSGRCVRPAPVPDRSEGDAGMPFGSHEPTGWGCSAGGAGPGRPAALLLLLALRRWRRHPRQSIERRRR